MLRRVGSDKFSDVVVLVSKSGNPKMSYTRLRLRSDGYSDDGQTYASSIDPDINCKAKCYGDFPTLGEYHMLLWGAHCSEYHTDGKLLRKSPKAELCLVTEHEQPSMRPYYSGSAQMPSKINPSAVHQQSIKSPCCFSLLSSHCCSVPCRS